MAQFDLNRAGDTPIATLKLNEITPLNWRKFPPPVADATPAYVPVKASIGGAYGDDVSVSTATVMYTSNSPAPENPAYAPKTQSEKATSLGTTIVQDITRPRGYLEPDDPYGTPVPPTPVISSLTPATIAVGQPPVNVVITGTGFTQWSVVRTGNVDTPYYRYISPTKMAVLLDPIRSTPGTISVTVGDHGVSSAPADFIFT